jgi:uncharacterized protein YndB with AHSA1/START domain
MAEGFEGTFTLVVRRTFPAQQERVFRAWTEREAIERWFRLAGRPIIARQMDVCVGGRYHFEAEDGSLSVSGTYLEIVPPEKLVFTWSAITTGNRETVVTVAFVARGGTTQIVLTHEGFTDESVRLLHRDGWQRQLDALAAVLD